MTTDSLTHCVTVHPDPHVEQGHLVVYQTDHPSCQNCRQVIKDELDLILAPLLSKPRPVRLCLKGHARSSSVVVVLMIVRFLVKHRVPNIKLCCEHANTADLVKHVHIDQTSSDLLALTQPCSKCEPNHHSHTDIGSLH